MKKLSYRFLRKTDERDELRGVGGGIGPGFNVYAVPVSKLRSTENITGMKSKMLDVEEYAERLRRGSEPPALFGHLMSSGNVKLTSGSRRLLAAKLAGVETLPVVIVGY